jgi:integrase
MNEENRLTARQVATVGDGWHSDGNRLYLRVKGPRRRWIVKVVREGVKREIGIGSVDTTSLAVARKKRNDILAQLRDDKDPLDERRKERAARAAAKNRKTFGEVAAEVLRKQESGWRTASDGRQSSLTDWTKGLTKDCAQLTKKPIEEVTTQDVVRVLRPLWAADKHATARRLVTRIAMVMNFATAHGLRSGDNPASWKIVQHLFPAKPNGGKQRHAALSWSEVPAFAAKLRESEARSMAALCVEFAILTAARSGEARGARWSEIDFEHKIRIRDQTITIPAWIVPGRRMKAAEEHIVPLSRQAVALLKRVQRAQTGDLIFEGQRRNRPLGIRALLDAVQKLAPGVTVHGFRSSFRSWCGDQAVDREVAEQCLAHVIGNAVEQAYQRSAMVLRRAPAMQDWADLVAPDGATASGKVVPIKRGRK